MRLLKRLTCQTIGLAAALAACGDERFDPLGIFDNDTLPISANEVIAFVDVSLVTMETETVRHHQTVLITGGRITALGDTTSVAPSIPASARIVRAPGAYVMPGLIDMHVHSPGRDLDLFTAYGVTTVRVMWGYPGIEDLQNSITTGARRGPWIFSISPGIDGHPPSWPYTQFAEDAAAAVRLVDSLGTAGWAELKVYNHLPIAAYDAVIAEARARGIRVFGHVPFAVSLDHAFASRQDEIEHLTGYDRVLIRPGNNLGNGWSSIDESKIADLAARTAAAGVWNCPTLAIYSAIYAQQNPDRRAAAVANRGQVVKALHDAGARLVLGTDSGIDIVSAGSALADELRQWVAAGLTPYQSLRAATVDAAEWLRQVDQVGVVKVGARADLLLVRANPLEDVETVRDPLEWRSTANGFRADFSGRSADHSVPSNAPLESRAARAHFSASSQPGTHAFATREPGQNPA